MSLFQFCSESNCGQLQKIELFSPVEVAKYNLPESYTAVPTVVLNKESVSVPRIINNVNTGNAYLDNAKSDEVCWLKHAVHLLDKPQLECSDAVTWAAYHASLVSADTIKATLSQLMPVFYEKAATAAMVKHGLCMQQKAIEYLNPGQIPVTAFDAPLFALAKLVQWKWPATQQRPWGQVWLQESQLDLH